MTHIDVYLYTQKNRLIDICKSNLIYTGRYSYKEIQICKTFFGKGNGNPLQYSCQEIPQTEEPSRLQSMGSQESDTTS